MALARVVSFEGVGESQMEEMRQRMDEESRPDDIPATEILALYDAGAEKSLVVVLFDNDEDYQRADATLNAMPAEETPGRRAAVGKYEVAVRKSF